MADQTHDFTKHADLGAWEDKVRTSTKVVLAVIGALLLVIAAEVYGKGKTMYTIEDLAAQYAAYNEVYFMGQLPTDTKFVLSEDLRTEEGKEIVANTICMEKHCTITINPKFNISFNQAVFSEVHEMCHIKLNTTNMKHSSDFQVGDHGEEFNACMISIADRGGMNALW